MSKSPHFEKVVIECLEAIEYARNAYLDHLEARLAIIQEDGFDDQRIRDAQARIEDLRRETERQKNLIRGMKDRIRRRKELERIRKSQENEEKNKSKRPFRKVKDS